MVLNRHLPDPNPRIMILSCPKTGNVWMRWLLHHAYKVPIVDVPVGWSTQWAHSLPPAFVTHQHFSPSPEIVEWLARNRVTVVTTIRHPGDTLLSYFHFMKWGGSPTDAGKQMVFDGDRPGDRTLEFVKGAFVDIYSISVGWGKAGAKVIRYESLMEDPVATLRTLTDAIEPIDDQRARAAALLSSPEQVVAAGLDRRHVRTASSGGWAAELRADIVQAMAETSPYREACDEYGYHWDPNGRDSPPFDYASIDPFRGKSALDNGEPTGAWMSRIYLLAAERERERWPDPSLTVGDSFWNWLISPFEAPGQDRQPRGGSLPNMLLAIRALRPDLQKAFPDPGGADRAAFLKWFSDHGVAEYRITGSLAAIIRSRFS